MPHVDFDRYYRYDELTDVLHQFAQEHPELVRLESIGKSYEGRDVWIVTVTDTRTGEAADKPAFWCDGNIHASEVSASTTVLMILKKLVEDHRDLLKQRAFYLVPRLNPDGAEWALADVPRLIRSSTRPYPFDEEDPEGLERKDMDGDGRILNMRIEDPNGPWKKCEQDPRLLVRREPGETGGTYYRVMPEGTLHHFDGIQIRPRKIKEGLDLNRNFPSGWRGEHEQYGAGPYPTSEPEIRNAVQAIVDRPNICGAMTFHTFSGVLLRPPGRYDEKEMPSEDLWSFQTLGKKGTDMTGYAAISVYHDFRYHPKEVISGVFDDWVYEHRGVHAWTVEIWSPQRQAGITDYKFIDWFREHPVEDDLKLLEWSDTKLEGKGYVDWYEFDHPQLGKVELGGWDAFYAFRNPPPQFLEAEVTPLADWTIWHAQTGPLLAERTLEVSDLAGGLKRIRWAVHNEGYLPTNVTKHAAEKKLCRGVIAEIRRAGEEWSGEGESRPDWLHAGQLRQDGGQLTGWNHTPAGGFGWNTDATTDVTVFEWIVGEGEYELVAKHERAGTLRAKV